MVKGPSEETPFPAIVSAGLAAVGAASAGPVPAALAAAGDAGPAIVELFVSGWRGRRRREVSEWWDAVVMDNGSEQGAAAQIAARVEDPVAQEVIVGALRALLDRVAPVVVPALGMLTREYLREGKEPDAFFRGMARVLGDLTAAEYEVLRNMAVRMRRHHMTRRLSFHVVSLPGMLEGVQLAVDGPSVGRQFDCAPGDAAQVFHLLSVNGLGNRTEETRSTRITGIEMTAAVGLRIASVIPGSGSE